MSLLKTITDDHSESLPEEHREIARETMARMAVRLGAAGTKEYAQGLTRLKQAFAEFEKSMLTRPMLGREDSPASKIVEGRSDEVKASRKDVADLVRQFADLYERGQLDELMNFRDFNLLVGDEMGIDRDDLKRIDDRASKRAVIQALSSARKKLPDNQK